MSFIKTKALLQDAYRNFADVHEMTDKERSRLQQHLVLMYKEIETICIKHNLKIMLAYGSALGAVRHGGFIPWDDDLDLFMPRKDYDLFINQYADELPEFLKVFAPNSKNKAYGRFAKVIDIRTKFIRAGAEDRNEESQGIFVDIFPLDSIKQTPLRNQLSRFVCMALMYIGSSVGIYEDNSPTYKRLMTYSSSTKANYWLRHILGYMFSFIKYEKWMNIIDCFCKNDKETGYVDDLVGVYKWQPVPKSVFVPPVRGRFEGEDVFLPHEVVFHLENSYGNWQWVPPEDKREQHFIRYIKFD